MACQCNLCLLIKEHKKQIELLPVENREYFINFFDHYLDVSYDLDFYKYKYKELKGK